MVPACRPSHAAAAACLLLTSTVLAQKIELTEKNMPPGYVMVDGKVNPELIPQWLLWRESFRNIAMVEGRVSAFTAALVAGLSPDEMALLNREGQAQRKRDDRLIERGEQILRLPLDNKDKQTRLTDLEFEYRWEVLHARDAVLDALSPDSREVLRLWADGFREGITFFTPDLEQYRRPQ